MNGNGMLASKNNRQGKVVNYPASMRVSGDDIMPERASLSGEDGDIRMPDDKLDTLPVRDATTATAVPLDSTPAAILLDELLARLQAAKAAEEERLPQTVTEIRETPTVKENLLRYYGIKLAVLSYASDLILIVLALFFTFELNRLMGYLVPVLPVIIPALISWSVASIYLGVYNPDETRFLPNELKNVFISVAATILTFAGIEYLLGYELPRNFVFLFAIASLTVFVVMRLGLRAYYATTGKARYPVRKALIVGTNPLGEQTAQVIEKYTWSGISVAGFVGPNAKERYGGYPVLGNIYIDIAEIVTKNNITEIFITLPHKESHYIQDIMLSLQHTPVYIYAVPDSLTLSLYHATSSVPEEKARSVDLKHDAAEVHFINLRAPMLTARQYILKRLMDIVISASIILATSPIMLITALAIKLDSPGPIIYKSKRMGENGRIFHMYKFRSMCQDADVRQKDIIKRDKDGNIIHKSTNDSRVTRVGKFIRKTSIDELAQMFNIFKGDMSLVGPRPELPMLVYDYQTWQFARFAVPQGLTGWWQVNGRSSKLMHLHTEYDLYYVQNYSLMLDVKILWKTVPAVVKRSGAF
jgi:exopolysaccharide biosynthesis polyprenyl glycosylphosphotransferase